MTTNPSKEPRDWLVLSLKWSTGDWLVWYRTACAGYTSSLIHAGRFTEAEARSEQLDGVTLAVSLDQAVERLAGQMVLRNDKRMVNRLRRFSKKRQAK